jgi:hypothetical protein
MTCGRRAELDRVRDLRSHVDVVEHTSQGAVGDGIPDAPAADRQLASICHRERSGRKRHAHGRHGDLDGRGRQRLGFPLVDD